MSDSNIVVYCRFRPPCDSEGLCRDASGFSLFFPDEASVDFQVPGRQKRQLFSFDRVFHGEEMSQEDIYNLTARSTVEDVLSGYNGTIFAYGQTGSGKTHTMFGSNIQDPSDWGVIPRACSHLTSSIVEGASGTQYAIKVSFLEIYKENVRDLLAAPWPVHANASSGDAASLLTSPRSAVEFGPSLRVREAPSVGVWVEGLSEVPVRTFEDIMAVIKRGSRSRTVSATRMNETSSRSHSLFTLTLTQKFRDGSVKESKLSLADLAGSEKVSKTGATGQTLEEAKKINQSLSALGNCINSLSKSNRGHVPYRDSKLTHILRECLGGNSKTRLFITCSSIAYNAEETMSTLQFGRRAKFIKNIVHVNRRMSAKELEKMIVKLRKEIDDMKRYIAALRDEILKMAPDFDFGLLGDGSHPLAMAEREERVDPSIAMSLEMSPTATASSQDSIASSTMMDKAGEMLDDEASLAGEDFQSSITELRDRAIMLEDKLCREMLKAANAEADAESLQEKLLVAQSELEARSQVLEKVKERLEDVSVRMAVLESEKKVTETRLRSAESHIVFVQKALEAKARSSDKLKERLILLSNEKAALSSAMLSQQAEKMKTMNDHLELTMKGGAGDGRSAARLRNISNSLLPIPISPNGYPLVRRNISLSSVAEIQSTLTIRTEELREMAQILELRDSEIRELRSLLVAEKEASSADRAIAAERENQLTQALQAIESELASQMAAGRQFRKLLHETKHALAMQEAAASATHDAYESTRRDYTEKLERAEHQIARLQALVQANDAAEMDDCCCSGSHPPQAQAAAASTFSGRLSTQVGPHRSWRTYEFFLVDDVLLGYDLDPNAPDVAAHIDGCTLVCAPEPSLIFSLAHPTRPTVVFRADGRDQHRRWMQGMQRAAGLEALVAESNQDMRAVSVATPSPLPRTTGRVRPSPPEG